jgi:hypothetical protein
MHASLTARTDKGFNQGRGSCSRENRSGLESAKGTPRNLFTPAVAKGSEVVVPTRTPNANVTVGAESHASQ